LKARLHERSFLTMRPSKVTPNAIVISLVLVELLVIQGLMAVGRDLV
jgi:hypothetical protein